MKKYFSLHHPILFLFLTNNHFHQFWFSHYFLLQKYTKTYFQESLVPQWYRICLPVQEMRVQFLIQENPTCHGAAKPLHHNYLSLCSRAQKLHLLGQLATTTEAHEPQNPCSTTREAKAIRNCTLQRESSLQSPLTREKPVQQQRLSTAINK